MTHSHHAPHLWMSLRSLAAHVFPSHASGSGTVLGIMLIMIISVMLTASLVAGKLFICRERAQVAADTAALAASSADNGLVAGQSACAVAKRCAELNHAEMTACTKDIATDDMKVTVSYATHVIFFPHVTVLSRAGPTPCR